MHVGAHRNDSQSDLHRATDPISKWTCEAPPKDARHLVLQSNSLRPRFVATLRWNVIRVRSSFRRRHILDPFCMRVRARKLICNCLPHNAQ